MICKCMEGMVVAMVGLRCHLCLMKWERRNFVNYVDIANWLIRMEEILLECSQMYSAVITLLLESIHTNNKNSTHVPILSKVHIYDIYTCL